MFTYTLRNLRSMFMGQRLLSLLLVLNIIVSCLVICFSYGLYENYHQVMTEGVEQEAESLPVYIDSSAVAYFDDAPIPTCDITARQLIDMMQDLQHDTQQNISLLHVTMITKTPLMFVEASDGRYSEDAETSYLGIHYNFRADGDKILYVDYMYPDNFTEEQYNNGEKVAVINSALVDELDNAFWQSTHWEKSGDDRYTSVTDYVSWTRTMPENSNEVIIGGEKYEVIKTLPAKDYGYIVEIPVTAAPSDSRVNVSVTDGEDKAQCLTFNFNGAITKGQYNDIKRCLKEHLGNDVSLEDMEFATSDELNYYRTVMAIAVIIAVLAAINMAILYRYILEKRSSELAIFRICGCSKGKAIASYLLECMMINAPLFALTQLIYHKLIMPRLTGLFPYIAEAYHIRLYLAMFGLYVAASVIVMLIMVTATVRNHSLVDLKKTAKSKNKLGIMKVFEVLQLAAVLSIMVMIVSAIVSRYEMFTPFEQYISRRGYIVLEAQFGQYENLAQYINGAEHIITEVGDAYDGDNHLSGISYSDEFINAYTPRLAQGIWLSDTDESYENSGYIPIVISPCDGRYSVGDILGTELIMGYDENDEPTDTLNVKYKVVGILPKESTLASYITDYSINLRDYSDMYGVYGDDTEPRDLALMRISDVYACFDGHAPLRGIQLVFCDNMSDAEYEEIGENLSARFQCMPLSEFYANSKAQIYEQMYTLFPIAVCIFILTIISTVSISAIYTKRQLRNYAIFYICGARWRTCALKSLKNGAITCVLSAVLSALVIIIGKATLLKETVISFGIWHLAVCAGVIVLYLILSMIMPLSIIGSSEPREVLKEE